MQPIQHADLSGVHIANPQVTAQLQHNALDAASEIARRSLAASTGDWGLLQLARGRLEEGFAALREAVHIAPDLQEPLHNYIASLKQKGRLRGDDLSSVIGHIDKYAAQFPWMRRYARVQWQPLFLNLEFVSGKCNLRCRMCRGTNNPNHPGKLEFMNAATFEQMLAAAPSIRGVTLSSGDSDPLLHPEFEQIIQAARRHEIILDIFTNGHAMTTERARHFVESGAVGMVNFSLDAATSDTYYRIRGGQLERVLRNIDRLQDVKHERGAGRPTVSLSLVAMADNIAELPGFVELAVRVGADRVYVEDLLGWQDGDDRGNRPAHEHPDCATFVAIAQQKAAEQGVVLTMSGHFEELITAAAQAAPVTTVSMPAADPPTPQTTCCDWLHGVWVNMDGRLDPCCLVHRAVDMGNIHDGPLWDNPKFDRVKTLLWEGKILPACQGKSCRYVREHEAAGIALPVMTRAELGELYHEPPTRGAAAPTPATDPTVAAEPVATATAT